MPQGSEGLLKPEKIPPVAVKAIGGFHAVGKNALGIQQSRWLPETVVSVTASQRPADSLPSEAHRSLHLIVGVVVAHFELVLHADGPGIAELA